MILGKGALTGNFDTNHLFPEGSDRARSYNDKLEISTIRMWEKEMK